MTQLLNLIFVLGGILSTSLTNRLLQYSIEKRHTSVPTLWANGNDDHDLEFVVYSKRSELGQSTTCEYNCEGDHDRDRSPVMTHLKLIPFAEF